MRLIDRYLLRHFLWPLIFTSLLFVVMFVIVDSLNNLDDFLGSPNAAKIITVYYASLIPVILGHILPSASLIACLYGLSGLNRHHELTAIKAGGVSGDRILKPLIFVAALLGALLFVLNETVTPKSAMISSSIKQGLIEQKSSNLSERSIRNVTLMTQNNMMIFAREFFPVTATLHDVIVLRNRSNFTVEAKTSADRAVYDGGQWTLYSVTEYELDERGEILGKPATLKAKLFPIQETPADFLKQHAQPELMSFRELKEHLQKSVHTGYKTSRRLEVELYLKTARPFIPLVLLLLCAPPCLTPRRGAALFNLGAGILALGLYYGTSAAGEALGKGGLLPPIAASWGPNLFFMIAGISLLRRHR